MPKTIREFLNGLSKEKPDLVRVMNIGRSYEGRVLQVVKISTELAKEKSYSNPAIFILAVSTCFKSAYAEKNGQCGCKMLRPCYKKMLQALQVKDEEACIEETSMGASTMMVFFKALPQFCGEVIKVIEKHLSFEGRHLYEVIIHSSKDQEKHNTRQDKDKDKGKDKPAEPDPVILVDAGQDAAIEPVELAMFLIEQLVACQDQDPIISKVRWVVLPCVNPDGMEYTRFDRPLWRKNTKLSADGLAYGVDITRNFNFRWDSCGKNENGFSAFYPGDKAGSENETIFVTEVMNKYKKQMKAYLSIRRDGHSILYPYAHKEFSPLLKSRSAKIAGDIAKRVNQRGRGIQQFVNDSIYNMNGAPHCGHSVDQMHESDVLAYEMRVYHGRDLDIISKFQALPKGYDNSLRIGYMSGILELFSAVVEDTKHHQQQQANF